jgi:GTP cyclohydrolase I
MCKVCDEHNEKAALEQLDNINMVTGEDPDYIGLKPKKFDYEKVKQSCKLFLEGIGEDPTREGLIETPDRFAKMQQAMLGGYDIDTEQYVKLFEAESQDMVVLSNINFISYCEHHVAPFFGKMSIGYIPDKKIIGLSKLVRIPRVFCKRLQNQERLVKQIADELERLIKPLGVAVHMQAAHTCCSWRGARSQGSVMTVSAVRGLFKDDAKCRGEFLEAIKTKDSVYDY